MPTSIEFLGVTDVIDDEKLAQGVRKTVGMFAEALKVLEDVDKDNKKDWKLKADIKEDKCFNKTFPSGKVYTLTKEFPAAANILFENHWNEIEKTSEWNPNVDTVERVSSLTDHVDILHYTTSDVVVVKGRDFVVCRIWRKIGDVYVVAASSIDSDIPVKPKKKRGWVNFCMGRFAPNKENADKTAITYLVNVDLKDKITPKMVLSSGIAEMAIKDARAAHKHVLEQLNQGSIEVGQEAA